MVEQKTENGLIKKQERKRAKKVVLCGSTKFIDLFDVKMLEFTLARKIVLTVGSHKFTDKNLELISSQKQMLDELHKEKIDEADSVYIINKDGYIGESTQSEIIYSILKGKPIEYMELLACNVHFHDNDADCENSPSYCSVICNRCGKEIVTNQQYIGGQIYGLGCAISLIREGGY